MSASTGRSLKMLQQQQALSKPPWRSQTLLLLWLSRAYVCKKCRSVFDGCWPVLLYQGIYDTVRAAVISLAEMELFFIPHLPLLPPPISILQSFCRTAAQRCTKSFAVPVRVRPAPRLLLSLWLQGQRAHPNVWVESRTVTVTRASSFPSGSLFFSFLKQPIHISGNGRRPFELGKLK